MSNSKISALTSATTPLAGTETLPVVQSGTTKQVTVANLTAGRSVSMADATLSTGNLTISTAGKGVNGYYFKENAWVNGTTGVTLPDASSAVVGQNDTIVGASSSTSYLIAKFTQNVAYRESAFWFQAFNTGDGGGLRTYVRAEGVVGASASPTANIGTSWGYETYNPASQLSISVYKNTTNGTVEIWLNVGTYGSGNVYVDFNYMTVSSAATVTWYGMQYPNPSSVGKTLVAASFTTL
jgi:hypothetical protein